MRRIPGKVEMRVTDILIVFTFAALFFWFGATLYLIWVLL